MASNLKVIFLFLWSLQYGGGQVSVQQRPPIQVALLRETISIPCEVTFPYIMKYTKFSIFYYWINSMGKKTFIDKKLLDIPIPPGEENKTTTRSYSHKTMPLENTSFTGTYYCEVKWNDIVKTGAGVFVLATDAGYIHTSYRWEILLTLTTIFAALSITGTGLLLWKRKVLCPGRNRLLNILGHNVESQPPSANPAPTTPIYDASSPPAMAEQRCLITLLRPTRVFAFIFQWSCLVNELFGNSSCLDSQQVDVYSVLESNTAEPSCSRSSLPTQTPKKQETLEESCDTLYENI